MDPKKSREKKTWISWILWGILILTIGRSMGGQQKVGVTVNADGMILRAASGYTETLGWEDIAEMELQEDFSWGVMAEGTDDGKEKSGSWTNDALGRYTLIANARVTSCIVCHRRSGEILAFNFESEESTQSLYSAIQEKLK